MKSRHSWFQNTVVQSMTAALITLRPRMQGFDARIDVSDCMDLSSFQVIA